MDQRELDRTVQWESGSRGFLVKWKPELSYKDIADLAAALPEIDKREAAALLPQMSLLEYVSTAISLSERYWGGYQDGEFVGVGGVVQLTEKHGSPWFLHRDGISRIVLVRIVPHFKRKLTNGYDSFENVLSVENKASIRWLKWLGFMFADDVFQANGVSFKRFFWLRERGEL